MSKFLCVYVEEDDICYLRTKSKVSNLIVSLFHELGNITELKLKLLFYQNLIIELYKATIDKKDYPLPLLKFHESNSKYFVIEFLGKFYNLTMNEEDANIYQLNLIIKIVEKSILSKKDINLKYVNNMSEK
jgi:hypothetical protein